MKIELGTYQLEAVVRREEYDALERELIKSDEENEALRNHIKEIYSIATTRSRDEYFIDTASDVADYIELEGLLK